MKHGNYKTLCGIIPNAERMICGKCGHGKKGDFFPLAATDPCPKCDNQRRHIALKQYLDSLMGREFWQVVEIEGSQYAIPIKVTSVLPGRDMVAEWDMWDAISRFGYEIDENITFHVDAATPLYESEWEAEKAMGHVDECCAC